MVTGTGTKEKKIKMIKSQYSKLNRIIGPFLGL